MGDETSVIDMMWSSNAARTDLPFADAPFELEDISRTLASSSSIQTDNILYLTTASYPTQGQVQQELRSSYRGTSLLTEAEERSLQDIGMPYYALSNIKVTSAATLPIESQSSPSPSPSPEQRSANARTLSLKNSQATQFANRESGLTMPSKRVTERI
ncbi:uncharacterized protein RAG0_15973 [Rhynchosporium agropyri]|uniref:Uncharacterized protein n=2 Tax=Rhynchosporium TaxID=38037 RepID=A0A1E1MT39_RHYSE|nr:uncharacterized protein RAG0_15973 [Rhynchosporium agropyri]CZT52258.1 uncharacterized protein RSE6_13549 [Rhynchosporium secalis]